MIVLKPETIEEAIEAHQSETALGRIPLWYSGGTEILSFLRKGTLNADTLIDLKGIPAYISFEGDEFGWTIGGGVPLNRLLEAALPESLGACIAPIADHTVRNRLSLAGNLCGRLPYRESILPLLALNAQVLIASPDGVRTQPLKDRFNRTLKLEDKCFMAGIRLPRPEPDFCWGSSRKVRLGPVDYPIVHVLISGHVDERTLHISGLCPFPITLEKLTDIQLKTPERLQLPVPPQDDRLASRDYRVHLFRLALTEALYQTGGTQ